MNDRNRRLPHFGLETKKHNKSCEATGDNVPS